MFDDGRNKKRAKERSRKGLTRELQQTRSTFDADPSLGGARGYALWYRMDVMEVQQQQGARAAADNHKCCLATVYNWDKQLLSYEMTGGRQRSQLVGRDLLLLMICIFIFPTATADEIAAFIVNNGGGVYERRTISSRLKDMDITRKIGSTRAFQAFLSINIQRKLDFFNQPPSVGVHGLRRRVFIDFDETGIFLEMTNRKRGFAHVSIRIRKPGFYTKSQKLTVICAVEARDPTLHPNQDGSIANPRRWYWISQDPGPDQQRFSQFVDRVLTDCETSGLAVDNDRILL